MVIYSAASFAVSVASGLRMRGVGKREGSPLVLAEADLWVVEGWLALGVCAAFAAFRLAPATGDAPARG